MTTRARRWSWIFDFVTMVAVLVGLTFGALELRQFREAQESQALVELFRAIQTPEYSRGVRLVRAVPDGLSAEELRGILDGPDGADILHLRLTFEGLGVMVYRRDVSIEWVDEMFHRVILLTWDKFEPLTLAERAEYPSGWEWNQWLAERLRERSGDWDAVPAYEAYRGWKP